MRLSRPTWLLALLLSSAPAISGCIEDDAEDATETQESDLIGGSKASLASYPSAMQLNFADGTCSGTLIGPRLVLTAAHCVDTPSGSIAKTADAGARVDLIHAGAPTGARYTIERSVAHPAREAECKRVGCPRDSEAMKSRDQPDVAVVHLAEEVAGGTVARVHTSLVEVGSVVTIAGFGCTDGAAVNRRTSGLKIKQTKTLPDNASLHMGSDVEEGDVDRFGTSYLFTAGLTKDLGSASICPGDSGGPLFVKGTDGQLEVVGVHSTYTFYPVDFVGVSAVNWHTRLDDSLGFRVGVWLAEQVGE